MKGAALALGVLAIALAVCAASVFGLGDRRTLASPPEAVAENFLRATCMKRYPQAARYLSEDARRRVGDGALSDARDRLDAAVGGIEDVRGEESWIAGNTAEATGELRGRRRTLPVRLRLLWEKGEWRVAGIASLTP